VHTRYRRAGFQARRHFSAVLIFGALLFSGEALAQQTSTPPLSAGVQQPQAAASASQQVTADVAQAGRRYRAGIRGGVGFSPQLIEVGGHVNLGPIFTDRLTFRPGIGLAGGEVTTTLGFNLDLLYRMTSDGSSAPWRFYAGGGPNFALSHESFQADVPVEGTDTTNRLDFSDTDFETGLNIIFGARRPSGVFFEMNATAWGAHNVRLLIGYDF